MAFCAYCGTQLAEVSYAPCPSCGNPSNGAARGQLPPGVKPKSNTAQIVIIVIVVVFFGVAILGILAAIAIPNIMTAKDRATQKRTIADMRTLTTALEAYATDNNQYPDVGSVSALKPYLSPTFVRDVPAKDGWGHDFRYECWSRLAKCDSYAVASAGKDGVFEHESLQDYLPDMKTTGFASDIVYSNGNFVQFPDGTQR